MPTRTARTGWTGTLEQGVGKVELSSSKIGTFDVSFPKRAADDAGRRRAGGAVRHQVRHADDDAGVQLPLQLGAAQPAGWPVLSSTRLQRAARAGSMPALVI